MKHLIVALLISATLAVNSSLITASPAGNSPPGEEPTVNLPLALRQRNWLGNKGQGSCVHASFIMLLRWQGHHKMAEYWRSRYGNGEWYGGLVEKMEANNIRYAYTSGDRNVKFLEWACRTRRGCLVTCMGGRHAVLLVHLDSQKAGILDNNYIERIKWVSREQFLAEWFNSSSWACTPVYTPAPPMPAPATKESQ